MIPILYPATETAFATNGLGGLPDAISCVVTEQRNTQGGYWLEMDYPVDGIHYDLLVQERIIYAAPAMGKAPQPFRIRRISRPIDGIVHIEAPHVSAELQKIVTYGRTVSNNPEAVWYTLTQTAIGLGQSTRATWLMTDILSAEDKTIEFAEPTALSDILVGHKGSIVDTYGGELSYDNWLITLKQNRGVDSGIEIRYGVNMNDIEAETDTSELVTAVIPYWKGSVNNQDVVVVGDMCSSGNAGAFAYVRCIPLDVSSQFDLEQDQQPSKTDVTAKGQAYISATDLDELTMSINVKYTPITKASASAGSTCATS
jgi:phage minor structural protein